MVVIRSGAQGSYTVVDSIFPEFTDLLKNRYALYSSLSPGLQAYLEGLTAVHSAVAQAQGSRAAGTHVRRQEIETIHPIVRVHPVTGWKSIYVNPGAFTP